MREEAAVHQPITGHLLDIIKGKAFTPSTEQQAIVELCRMQNVVVSARPGAGKTATARAIVAANPDLPIAIITYSKRLQLDTARRLDAYPGRDVFTFYGLAGQLFSTIVRDDSIMRSLRRKITLICVFISAVTHAACGRAPQIVVLGDERQAIYGFRGADSRYLSLSSSAMVTLSPYPWTHLSLSKSFRLSHKNSAFVNNVFLGGKQYIVGSHIGLKLLYLFGNYRPECTAILAPKVLQIEPLQILTNHLSNAHGIPIAKPNSDNVPLDNKILQGKGNKRDLVIVYSVDASYFRLYARDLLDNTCPNNTFVALTRARKQLVVVHYNQNSLMPFINVAELYKTANFVNFNSNGEMPESEPPGRPLQLGLLLLKTVSASDLPRHVPNEIIDDICGKHLQINQAQSSLPDALPINAPPIVPTDSTRKHYEAVSNLNRLAVVASYEHALLGTLTTLGRSKALFLKVPSNTKAQAIWLCRKACKYKAEVLGYISQRVQIKGHHFDWLKPYLNAARDQLEAQFPKSAVLDFEEIKFVAQLSLEHVIQACVYAYLWSNEHKREKPPQIILFNIRDGEKWEIAPHNGVASLRGVVEETLVAKFSTKDTLTTDEFLKKCAKTKAEVEKRFGKKTG
ncbi:P-loop containing nucleoside triphosphate hydrolase protein [Melanomma pulvis-pyrius CBS 109.77]|uniref:P-loop containing nucleoside triphosphate hydrolase protein n=1 Tax=Melanomma pulvis-pyrius CBS 109.77 TaxID=1314802 RepID=A0A6A6XL38_9PLEO|nr:P-loop containing nucleoside triphosphate hydrolase protein [Melanomma pulvis-pyrius CBS 109.77]